MRAEVTYKDGSKETFKKLTEVHYCFPSSIGKQIAFESDILQTGCTKFLNDIEEVKIFSK